MSMDMRHRVSKPISRMARTGALDFTEVKAARAIEEAVLSIATRDIHSSRFESGHFSNGLRGGGFEDTFLRLQDLRRSYYDWIGQMRSSRLPAGPVLDVIIDGKALSEVDRAWKKRKGWARGVLVTSLQLFIETQGREVEEKKRLTA